LQYRPDITLKDLIAEKLHEKLRNAAHASDSSSCRCGQTSPQTTAFLALSTPARKELYGCHATAVTADLYTNNTQNGSYQKSYITERVLRMK
jgi:hypothetical protein